MESARKVLETLIESCLAKDGEQADVVNHAPEDVFRLPLPRDTAAAFITINSVTDVEAARQFARLYETTPFVVISDNGDYAVEAFRLNARHYIIRPVGEVGIREAVSRCRYYVVRRRKRSGDTRPRTCG